MAAFAGKTSKVLMVVILFCIFALLMAFNAPVSFSLGVASVITAFLRGDASLIIIPQKIFTSLDSFPLLAIPLFILAGSFLETGGVGMRLVNLANVLVRHVSGGLGFVVIVSTIFFSEISGSSAADAAAIGSVTIPAMVRLRYNPAFATAIVAASGGMAALIPPSIIGVIYGWQANTSVGAVFLGGFLPGFIMGGGLCAYTYYYARKMNFPTEKRATAGEVGRALKESLPALIMPVIILGGIFSGIFTATEAAAVAVVYGFVVALLYYRELKLKDIPRILVDSAVTTGFVGLLLGLASVFGWVLTVEQTPAKLANLILSIAASPWVFLLLVNILFLIAGCFLNATAILIILVPILLPMVHKFGIDPVHFGVMLIANLGIGYVTPPVGTCLYVACGISKQPLSEVIKPLAPFIFVMIAMLLLVTYIPWISLVIPNLVYGR
ncbi:MAG TPA: TRAP transporter large permease [Thermodesulfobacteriota bacterium]|nr:TRAP transporter large permease [Thermodesulfobacteriota bacterium]